MRRYAAILCITGLLSGCASDPLEDVPRLSQADIGENEFQVSIRAEPGGAVSEVLVAPEPKKGFFAGLLGAKPSPDSEVAAPTEVALVEPEPIQDATNAQPRGGLLGFLSRAAQDAKRQDQGADVQLAALPAAPTNDAEPAPLTAKASSKTKPGDPDHLVVQLGATLPFGSLARVCDVRKGQLGKRVERYPEKRNTYAIYDSQPGNTAAHTFYITGFGDGCVRQFTAALALFGSPQTHEQLRYGLPSKVQPYSETDAAYERLKSKVCRVGHGKPCGSGMSRLARDTAFVSVYEKFGSNAKWKTILLHDGQVVETDIRGN